MSEVPLYRASGFARASRSACTSSGGHLLTATCSAVRPSVSTASVPAPAASSARSACGDDHVQIWVPESHYKGLNPRSQRSGTRPPPRCFFETCRPPGAARAAPAVAMRSRLLSVRIH